jgi:hypothetical protein
MKPLQLLSMPSQISAGRVPHVPHSFFTPSSTGPLQLLSLPSQTSAEGALATALQAVASFVVHA